MKNTNLATFSIFLVFTLNISLGQNANIEPQYFNWFDKEVQRKNTSLFNGVEYIELYRTINDKHKFFGTSEFQMGSLVYDGQFFDQVPLKYDLDADNLLLNVGYNYPYPILILFKSKIQSFSLQGADFIQVPENTEALGEGGFYEVLYKEATITLLKKNTKKRFKRIRGNTLYYEFMLEGGYALHYDGIYYEISNKKDLIRIWPQHKEFINENFNSALRKIDEDTFWVSFFSKLVDIINIENKGE